MPANKPAGFNPTQLYPYDPRLNPLPAPTVGIFEEPTVAICINAEWASHIDGVLERLRQPDAWTGDETEQRRAVQEIEKLLVALAIGQECMPYDPCCPEELELLEALLRAQRKTNQILSETQRQNDANAAYTLSLLDDGEPQSIYPSAGETWDQDANGNGNNLCGAIDSYIRTMIQQETQKLDAAQLAITAGSLALAFTGVGIPVAAVTLIASQLSIEVWQAIINDERAIEEVVCRMLESLQGQSITQESFKNALNPVGYAGSTDPNLINSNNNAIALNEWMNSNNQGDANYRAFLAHLEAGATGDCPCGCGEFDTGYLFLPDTMYPYSGGRVVRMPDREVTSGGITKMSKIYRVYGGIKELDGDAIEYAAGFQQVGGGCCSILEVANNPSGVFFGVVVLGNTAILCDDEESFNPAGGPLGGCVKKAISKIRVNVVNADVRAALLNSWAEYTFDPDPAAESGNGCV